MTHRTCECQVLPCCCSPAHVLPCSCSLCSPAVEPPASLTLPLLTLFHLRCRSADARRADGLLRLLRLVFPSPRRLLLCCPPSSVSDRPPWSNPQPLSILLQAPPWQRARAAQLFLRSRAHSRERARCAHTGAQQIDAQRSRLIAHSLSRLECRLPLKANRMPGGCGGRVPRKKSLRERRVLARSASPSLYMLIV